MYHDKYQNIMRSYKSHFESAHFKQKLNSYFDESTRLFDFLCCICVNFANYICANEKQVPQIEQSFLADLRRPRRKFIGSSDGKRMGEMEKKRIR